jgi:D,D-heptose 1,7-bisphosphate phosphatase
MNRAIFLDRDGTLNPDPGYISDPELFNLYPGTGEALSRLQQAGYLLILITNQSGIARGLLTHAQLAAIHDKLQRLLAEFSVKLSGIYYCPHHPDFPDADGVAACSCRKPEPGLILQAIEELQIDPEHSFMIGDKTSDVELGLNAGVTPVFIGAEPAPGFASVVNFATLSEVADWILAAEHEQR